ncbi:MAG: alpha/beta hydrolase [Deltaproteobacteria bacterium]|nr:alpha/beta hydrolase [Deltaproteobacteria bacterium]
MNAHQDRTGAARLFESRSGNQTGRRVDRLRAMVELGKKTVGSGPGAVLVMHDWLGDHTNYDLAVPCLNREDFTWIFIDLRGHGLSRHHTGTFTCGEATDDVIRLADRLGIDRFHVVGHSMSSMIAQSIAVSVPDRVLSVIAITPLPASGLSLSRQTAESMRSVAISRYPMLEAANTGFRSHYKDFWLGARILSACDHSTPEARVGYMRMFTGTDFSARANGIRVPVRAIVGENDMPAFQKESVHDAFRKCYPDFQLIECRKAGHYPMLQFPALFASEIEQLLFSVGPSRGGSLESTRAGAQCHGR